MAFRIGRTQPPAAAPMYFKDILFGLTGVFRGRWPVTRFEAELREYYRVRHCFSLSSGKAALSLILEALKEISPDRDEVLIPAFTCYSVPSAIVRAGLKVRLCDLAPGTYDFDYEQLSNIIAANKDRLLCVVSVHLFGFSSDPERIRGIIADDHVFVVEDAAQAMGGEYNGKRLGTVGDVGFFSLGRGKAFSTVEGGVILTNRDDIARHLENTVNAAGDYSISELLVLFGYAFALCALSRPSLFWVPKALPYLRLGETIFDPRFKIRRLSAFQAGLTRGWESKMQSFRRIRAGNVQEMLKRLESAGLSQLWSRQNPPSDLIRFPLSIGSSERRDAIMQASERMGLGIARGYPDSVDRIPGLKTGSAAHGFSVAREHAERLLTLPIHPYVDRKNRDDIVAVIAEAMRA